MIPTNKVGMVVAEQVTGKVIADYVAPYADKAMKKELEPMHKKPSTYINLLGGLGMVAAAAYSKTMKPQTADALLIVGSNMLTKSVDYVAEAVKPAAGAGTLASPSRYGAGMRTYAVKQVAPRTSLAAPGVVNDQFF